MPQEEKNQNLPPQISIYGNPILEKKAIEVDLEFVEEINDDIIELISTMYLYGGIGLAGPQINIMKRIIVWDHQWIETKKKYKNLHLMINPEIIENSEEDIALYESCLSIPEVIGPVYRSKEIKVRYIDSSLEIKEEKFDGIDARVIQHEIDHLDGVLFVNRMNKYERDEIVHFLIALRQAYKKYYDKEGKTNDSTTS